ncbi:hypothetical protein VTK73DRAFT_10151 [Phialemonium thermophilum]|uniref:Helix-turn-helix domain-containing protein n=1 Tax=Phialemonium thermophilum TaxID=223376 RepID=A0ABR3XI93_9PEZI
MGSSASKFVTKGGARKFPTRAPGATPQPTGPPPPPAAPGVRGTDRLSQAKASYTKDEAIRADSINPGDDPSEFMNPAFSARLKQMGVAQPNPTFSPSSTASPSLHPNPAQNVTLGVLDARRRLQDRADRELDTLSRRGDSGGGREFLDACTLRTVLAMRQRGEAAGDIEAQLRLKPGVVQRLGPPGVVGLPTGGGGDVAAGAAASGAGSSTAR